MANLTIATRKFHSHDCSDCYYCGSFSDNESRDNIDVYFCPTDSSLIMREGSQGADYASFPLVFAELASVQSPAWAMAMDLFDRVQH